MWKSAVIIFYMLSKNLRRRRPVFMCDASRVSTYGHVEGKAEKVEEYVQLYDDGFVYTDSTTGGSGASFFNKAL